jgi:hypothetical protein
MHKLISGLPLLAALLAGPAFAATPAELLAKFGERKLVQAQFVQSRQMSALKKPLLTSGRLVFSARDGVLWQIEQPYRMGYILGEQCLIEIGNDGQARARSGSELAALSQVARIFRAMLDANGDALAQTFVVATSANGERWEMTLTPRDSTLAQFLSSVQLEGAAFVNRIRIQEPSGDSTTIRFSNSHEPASLAGADAQLLAKCGHK